MYDCGADDAFHRSGTCIEVSYKRFQGNRMKALYSWVFKFKTQLSDSINTSIVTILLVYIFSERHLQKVKKKTSVVEKMLSSLHQVGSY